MTDATDATGRVSDAVDGRTLLAGERGSRGLSHRVYAAVDGTDRPACSGHSNRREPGDRGAARG